MLISQPLMDVLRQSSSFSSSGAGLMRQPSADDLDAAQQLVESARGERQGTHTSTGQHEQTYPDPSIRTSPDNGQAPEVGQFHAIATEESNGLGQVCR